MKQNSVSALIVARPSRMRDGLKALLRTMPQINAIEQTGDIPTAIKMIMEHPPALILLDSNLTNGNVASVLRQTKAERLSTQCIVLVDNKQEVDMATMAGADWVLLAGFPAVDFFAAVESLLAQQEEKLNKNLNPIKES